ncbi:FAD/NAD(P)-binding protein [Candidatus Chloroploca sp. Khr17]|uniref:FAD/NAD(P)-binding protein n=1 Tax=Candidatus Chloroploca sp. Khr17 TaxID=2496869 RepID=UPI001F110DED|nr:FAD/NAD(P)-binding protein [Candidatus Chloroploca sp. Khr17]
MLDWLIIGGGLHGTHLALVLTARAGVPAERLRILDPHAHLLAHWDRCTSATGMTYLRSTLVHHLALDPHDLWHFARRRGLQATQFRGPYRRPALGLFRDHCQALIEQYGLAQLHLRGRATGLRRIPHGWLVETNQGSLAARHVLLALSTGEQPRWPDWAQALRAAGASVRHLYEPDACDPSPNTFQVSSREGAKARRVRSRTLKTLRLCAFASKQSPSLQGIDPSPVSCEDAASCELLWANDNPGDHTVVLGGGISAAQVAVALAQTTPGRVTLLMRHALRVEAFDSPPGWVGPKELRGFHDEPDVCHRRALITGARRPGSMPDDVARALRRAERRGCLRIVQGEVAQASIEPDGTTSLELPNQTLHTHHVLLATGFAPHRPGGAWLDEAIATYELPIAPCGYPIVSPSLIWAPGLYVTGALAELELGPVARNIAGARHAGARFLGKTRI